MSDGTFRSFGFETRCRIRHDRDKAQRESSRERLTNLVAYLLLGAVGLRLGVFILDLILGIDMRVVLSGAFSLTQDRCR
jgi:hypothetical protein